MIPSAGLSIPIISRTRCSSVRLSGTAAAARSTSTSTTRRGTSSAAPTASGPFSTTGLVFMTKKPNFMTIVTPLMTVRLLPSVCTVS
ncbi:unnamed protein product [Linum tenue]|uniref:Uncharacterized protein n=1 Tax=Linum tenue TaxID=586396 RepID=A0AAV0Q0D5_9ROSI|nr:unnamed protein product [Linum tenue]